MSQLDQIMAKSGLPAFRRVFGDDAIYTPPYTPPAEPSPISTWAMIRHGDVINGEYGLMHEAATTARLPISDVPSPKIGASLVVNSTTYRITRIADRTDYFTQVVLS
jgi:hypothetical protein